MKVIHLQPPEDRLSYFALRLRGKDITRLAEQAQKQGMKPSDLARALILRGLEQASGAADLAGRVALLDQQVAELKRELGELTKKLELVRS